MDRTRVWRHLCTLIDCTPQKIATKIVNARSLFVFSPPSAIFLAGARAPMINRENLANALTNHVAKCRSAQIVCRANVAAESWFRIELVPALVDAGVGLEHVEFNYAYADGRGKGDLAIIAPDFRAVFELKSFVCFADANKVKAFPYQLKKLADLVDRGIASQGLAFCTFCGYGDARVSRLQQQFFDNSWSLLGLRPFLEDAPLLFLLASRTRN